MAVPAEGSDVKRCGEIRSGRSAWTVARATMAGDFALETAEREFIIRALKETGWQRTRAAALLGITRATLHAKLKRYSITAPDGEAGDPDPLPPDDGGDLREACA